MDFIKGFSDDIRVFRNMVERSLSPKLYKLDKELNRLRALPDKCLEELAIKVYGKRHYKNPGFWGNLKAHGWDIIEGLDKLIKIFQGQNLPVRTALLLIKSVAHVHFAVVRQYILVLVGVPVNYAAIELGQGGRLEELQWHKGNTTFHDAPPVL